MSNQPAPKRIHQIIKLRPEHYEAYKKCHAAVWPEVIAQIKKCHIEDSSRPYHSVLVSHSQWLIVIVMVPDSISYDPSTSILFASFKYTGQDFDADMALMREHDKTREWWAMTDGYQESLNPGAVSSERAGIDGTPGWWKEVEEVFYLA